MGLGCHSQCLGARKGRLWVLLTPRQTYSSNTNMEAERKIHQLTSLQQLPVTDGDAIKLRIVATVLKTIGKRWIKVVVGISVVRRMPKLLLARRTRCSFHLRFATTDARFLVASGSSSLSRGCSGSSGKLVWMPCVGTSHPELEAQRDGIQQKYNRKRNLGRRQTEVWS